MSDKGKKAAQEKIDLAYGKVMEIKEVEVLDKIEFALGREENMDDIVKFITIAAEYDGLDAEAMRQIILQKSSGHHKEIMIMCALSVVRTANVSKLLLGAKGSAKDFVKAIKSKYAIMDRAGKDAKAITLGRVNICFPDVTARVLHILSKDDKWKPNKFLETPGLPDCLHFPAAASIIPFDSAYKEMHLDFFFSHQRLYNPKEEPNEDRAQDYWNNSHNSSLFSDKERYEILDKLCGNSTKVPESQKESEAGNESEDNETPPKKRKRND